MSGVFQCQVGLDLYDTGFVGILSWCISVVNEGSAEHISWRWDICYFNPHWYPSKLGFQVWCEFYRDGFCLLLSWDWKPLLLLFLSTARAIALSEMNAWNVTKDQMSTPAHKPRTLVMYWQINAFTDRAFSGNPAAVIFLPYERNDRWLQTIAREFNRTTAFLVKRYNTRKDVKKQKRKGLVQDDESENGLNAVENEFDLRWFSPTAEVTGFLSACFLWDPKSLLAIVFLSCDATCILKRVIHFEASVNSLWIVFLVVLWCMVGFVDYHLVILPKQGAS